MEFPRLVTQDVLGTNTMRGMKTIAGAVAFALLGFGAQAATVSVDVHDLSEYASLTAGWKNAISEDFETLGAAGGRREVGVLDTAVGSFTTLGGKGTGGTVTDKKNNTTVKNTGTKLALRDGTVYGRTNIAPAGGKWFLDSNDTFGMVWNVALAGGHAFNKLIFALTDASDEGAYLRVTVDGVVQEILSKLKNGTTKLFVIDFGGPVHSAKIELGNYTKSTGGKQKTNDGFSVDAIQVAPVPLPAGLVLLGSAVAGFGVIGRRRARMA